jgi:hypothetical protein
MPSTQVSFRLREPGFLRTYEGTWRVKPTGQPALNLHTRITTTSSPGATAAPGRQHPLPGVLASISTPLLLAPQQQHAPQLCCSNDNSRSSSRPASCVVHVQGLRMSPKVAPPSPLGGLLRNHAAAQVEDMMRGLLAAATRLHTEQQLLEVQAQQQAAAAAAAAAAVATQWVSGVGCNLLNPTSGNCSRRSSSSGSSVSRGSSVETSEQGGAGGGVYQHGAMRSAALRWAGVGNPCTGMALSHRLSLSDDCSSIEP